MSKTLPHKAQQAVDKLISCVDLRFTGTLVFEFNLGVPQLCRTTNTHRFEKDKDHVRLDEDRATK